MFYQLFRASRYFSAILALSLLLTLSCGDDEEVFTPTPHNFHAPDALAIASHAGDGGKEFLFIANSTEGTISIVDLTDNSLVDGDGDSSNGINPISVNGITPLPDSKIIRDIAVIPDGTLLIAAWVGPTSGFLSAIDTSGIFTGSGAGSQTTIPLSGQPHSIAINSGTVFITITEPESILSVICDGNTIICTEKEVISLDNSPRNIIMSGDTRFAYVTFFDSSKIATVNIAGPLTLEAAPLLNEGTVFGTPIDLAIDPDTKEAYITIASPTPYQLAVVDISSPTPGKLLGTYFLDGLPRRVAVTPKAINANGTTNRLVYVTNLNGAIQIIDDSSATEPEFTDSGDPSNPAISPILTKDRVTKTEDWTLMYRGLIPGTSADTGESNGTNTFSDKNANFQTDGVVEGDLLYIKSGPDTGTYTITSIPDEQTLILEKSLEAPEINLQYEIHSDGYLLMGSISGLQKARTKENELYYGDRIEFLITSGAEETTEGDKFTFSTHSGVSAISLEKLPGGIAISADGERAYIANTGSDSISIVDIKESEVIDTIR